MTEKQKYIMVALLLGGSIASVGHGKYRVRDKDGNPLKSFGSKTFYPVRKLCKKKKGLWIVDKMIVRGLHKKTFVNKKYWEILKNGQKQTTKKTEAGTASTNGSKTSSVVHFLE